MKTTIINNGLKAFPNGKQKLIEYAFFIECALDILLKDDNELSENFIGNNYKNSEKDWMYFFLSPIVTSWYFENRRKNITVADLEILKISFEKEYKKIKVSKNIFVYEQNPILFKYQLNQIKMGSKSNSSENADFLNPDSELFKHSISKIESAIKIIKRITPGYYKDILTFVDSITLVNDNASFNGASSTKRRGHIFFSPNIEWDEFNWAEEIIHESTHCLLEIISINQPFLLNNDLYEEKYVGPFRPDLRHLHGNFHALTVIARCIVFFDLLVKSYSDVKDRIQHRKNYFIERSQIPFEDLRRDAIFSDLGKLIFNNIINQINNKND